MSTLQCSWYTTQAQYNAVVTGWTCPTEGSSDLFHSSLPTSCFSSTQSVEISSVGQQDPRTGNAHSAIFVYGIGGCTPYREYVQGKLTTPLVAGQSYEVEMYVSLTDKSNKGCGNIGVKFSNTEVNVSSMCVYSTTPDLNYTGIITDKINWSKISFCYTPATSGAQYFMIGNFFNDASTSTAAASGGNDNTIRYFIDDVRIEPSNNTIANAGTNGTVSICPGEPAISLFSSLGGAPSTSGTWSGPSVLPGGYLANFDPSVHTAGVYVYSIAASSGACGTGTPASAQVNVSTNGSSNAAIAQPTDICVTGAAVQLTAATTGGTWLATCGNCITPGGLFNPAVAGVGAHSITYNIGIPCPGTDTKTITVVANPVVSAGSNVAICTNVSTQLVATGADSYVWSPSTGLSSTIGSVVTANPSVTTTYNVTGQNTACSGQSSVTVTVNPLPLLHASPSDSICFNDTTQLTVSGAAHYAWFPSQTLSSAVGGSVFAFPQATTFYTITGTDALGCVSQTSVTITVNALPSVSAGNNVSICVNDFSPLLASGASTYSWLPALGLSSTSGATVIASPANTSTYTVTGIDNFGCENNASVSVTVNPLPMIDAGQNVSICENGSATLAATGGMSYIWSPAQFLSDTLGAMVISTPSSNMAYTVYGINGNGCAGSDMVTVSILPPPSVSVGTDQAICNGNFAQIIATGAVSYSWSPSAISTLGTNNAIVTASPTNTTIYTATGTDANGCTASDSLEITVHPNPVVAFTANPTSGCSPLTVHFNQTGDAVVSYQWNFGNGTQSMQAAPSAMYVNQGSYSVGLTVMDAFGCTSSYSQPNIVTVYPYPQAGLFASPTQLWEDDPFLQIMDGSIDASSWQYIISDGSFYTVPSFSHSFSDTGHYYIVQVVTSNIGCSDTAIADVFVNAITTVYIPNAFTPVNNDNVNNTFKVYGNQLEEVELLVFSRWGELVFRSQDQHVGWDGTLNGKLCKQDVYVYKLSYKDRRKGLQLLEGSVTLVR